ncbi:MAG: 4Fe-4S binding protein [Thermoanaerobacterales bacterium]|nr:4Fe-4S binding protein [Thermoanaerobacterales bacterium]
MLRCSFEKEREYNLKLARLTIKGKWPDEPKLTICRQCAKAKCVEACKTGALTQRDGIIKMDESLCIRCWACIDACPFDAIHEFRDKIIKCDTCDGTYPCTTVCSTSALTIRQRGERQDVRML